MKFIAALIFEALIVAGLLRGSSFANDSVDRRVGDDVMVVLPGVALHLRIDVRQNGLTLDQCRSDYLDELMASLDTDHDGKLSRDESRRSPFFTDAKNTADNPFLKRLATRNQSSRSGAGMSREAVQTKVAAVVGTAMASAKTTRWPSPTERFLKRWTPISPGRWTPRKCGWRPRRSQREIPIRTSASRSTNSWTNRPTT